jgi:hypothetical protein
VTERRVPAPGERTAVCAVCGGPAFVPTEAAGPQLCVRHDVSPGTVVRDRETGDRLLVVDAVGERADRVETDEGRLVADYPSNAAYGAHEPVFRTVYIESLDRPGTPSRYAFPASRLRPTTGTGDGERAEDATTSDTGTVATTPA